MDRVGVRLEARGDGIKARLEFGEEGGEFLRRPFDRGVLEEEIDHFQTPNVGREIVFPFRLEQLVEERRGGGALRDCLEEFRGRLGDAVIAEQAFAHRGLDATVAGDLFFTCGPDRFQDFVDQQGIVGRVDRHRIAHFVGDAGPRERDLEMAGVLFRVGTV